METKESLYRHGKNAFSTAIFDKHPICVSEMMEILPIAHLPQHRMVDNLAVAPWKILGWFEVSGEGQLLEVRQTVCSAAEQAVCLRCSQIFTLSV